MPWPAIAAIAGKVLAGGAAAGAAGGAAGAAGGAAAGAGGGGMLGGLLGGGGGAGGAGGIMSKMGGMMGGGGSGGSGGGMPGIGMIGKGIQQGVGSIMNLMQQNKNQGHTQNSTPANAYLGNQTATERMNVARGGKIKRPSYQNGGMSPEFFDYLGKLTGQGLENAGQTMDFADTQGIQNAVQGADQGALQNVAQDATQGGIQGAAQGVAQNGNQTQLQTPQDLSQPTQEQSNMEQVVNNEQQELEQMNQQLDQQDTGGALKDSMSQLKSGNVVGAVLGTVSHFVNKKSAEREQIRQEQIAGGLHEQQQKRGSVYADPNSVYSAKDGASIPKVMKQNNNLASMMNYQNGGGTTEVEIMGEEQGQTENVPRYVEKGKSYHYNPNDFLGRIGNPDAKDNTYRRTFGDVMYDVLHPRKGPRVSMTFEDGGNTAEAASERYVMMDSGQPTPGLLKGNPIIPTVTVNVPLPDGNMITPSGSNMAKTEQQNMLGMMSGGKTPGYFHGGPHPGYGSTEGDFEYYKGLLNKGLGYLGYGTGAPAGKLGASVAKSALQGGLKGVASGVSKGASSSAKPNMPTNINSRASEKRAMSQGQNRNR